MRKIGFAMLVAALILVGMTGCKDNRTLFGDDGSEIMPVVNPEGRVELLNLRTGDLIKFGDKQVVEASLLHEGLMVLKVQEEEGIRFYYANEDGEMVLGPYASATIFSEGKAWVAKPQEHLQVIDKEGKTLFTLENAQKAEAFVNGKALFWTVGDEEGLINDKGEVLIEPQSNVYVGLIGKRFIAGTDSMWVLLNDSHREWSDNKPFGIRGRDMACVDSTDEFKMSAADNFIGTAREYERFAGTKEDMYRNLQVLVDINRRIQRMVEESRIVAARDGEWGVIDTLGKWIVEPEYEEVIPDDGLYMVVKDSMIGWIDLEGRKVIDFKYTDAEPFGSRKEMRVTRGDGSVGMLNRHGQFKAFKGDVVEQSGWKLPGKRRYVYAGDMGMAVRRMAEGSWMFMGDGYRVSDDLVRDYLSNTGFKKASSDYLEIGTIVAGLQTLAVQRNSITAGEMIANYPEQKFTAAKLMGLKGGEAMLEESVVSDSLYITLFAEDIHCTTQVYTGWMERLYDTVFSGSARINRFRFEVSVGGKLRDRFDELQKAIKESGDWSVEGKRIVVECDAKGEKIVIRINPGKK